MGVLPHSVLGDNGLLLILDLGGEVLDLLLVRIFHVLIRLVKALGLELVFFPLEGQKFLLDLGVDEIGNVLAVPDLGDSVVLPLVVHKQVFLW